MLGAAELDRLRVVLVATRNPLNIGAAARAMSNFGFHRLRVVNPYHLAFREARSAVGASDLLARAEEYDTVAEAVADCTLVVGTTAARNRDLQHRLERLHDAARRIRKWLASAPVALLFGSEKRGLSNKDLSHCHWLAHVPTSREHPSMNLGQAVAVCLYELSRQSSPAARIPGPGNATGTQFERVTSLLLEALRVSGYLTARRAPASEEKVRRLVRRLKLSAADAELLTGMLRQISWKLQSGKKSL